MAGEQLGMIVVVWAFSFVSGVFGFEEETLAFKVFGRVIEESAEDGEH